MAEDVSTRQLIGYILFFNTPVQEQGEDIMAVVEDLYVTDSYRGRGVATQLLRKVIKVRKLS